MSALLLRASAVALLLAAFTSTTALAGQMGPEGPALDGRGAVAGAEGARWSVGAWSRPSAAAAPAPQVADPSPSLQRHVAWGAGMGAAAGLVSGLLVRATCDEPCDGTVAEGMALHIGIGTLVGAGTGALVAWIRGD